MKLANFRNVNQYLRVEVQLLKGVADRTSRSLMLWFYFRAPGKREDKAAAWFLTLMRIMSTLLKNVTDDQNTDELLILSCSSSTHHHGYPASGPSHPWHIFFFQVSILM